MTLLFSFEGSPSLHGQKALDALRAAERLQPGFARGECLEPDLSVLRAFPEYHQLLAEGAGKPAVR
jgi:hypothetical protein